MNQSQPSVTTEDMTFDEFIAKINVDTRPIKSHRRYQIASAVTTIAVSALIIVGVVALESQLKSNDDD